MKELSNYKNNLKSKIKKKKAKIGIIGLGYVGLPLALLFSKKGFFVNGFDIDKDKIKILNRGKSPIERTNADEVSRLKKKGNFYSNFSYLKDCDIIIISVPTPLTKSNKPDLSFLRSAVNKLLHNVKKGQLIVLESTSYPGTTRDEIVKKIPNNFTIGKDLFVSFSSERINPGVNDKQIQKIPKVLSGYSSNCLFLVNQIYSQIFNSTVKAKSLEIAEFSKLLENVYRAVNIGFINEMKFVADKMNLDIYEIIKVAKTKPYGFRPFHPGPGTGGHCIPIDPSYLYWQALNYGIKAEFIKLSAETNLKVIDFIKKKITKFIKNDKNKKILFLGIAYKKNIDDIRESGSLKLAKKLQSFKYKNIYFSDPHINKINNKNNFFKNKISLKLNQKNLQFFDLVILLTDHDKFNYQFIKKNSKIIFDCRGKFKVNKKIYRI
jgi:UDP-N-acetyl-D-glucosamine dehydrogenase